jgi:DNA-binding CsgD family transcriptional regulator
VVGSCAKLPPVSVICNSVFAVTSTFGPQFLEGLPPMVRPAEVPWSTAAIDPGRLDDLVAGVFRNAGLQKWGLIFERSGRQEWIGRQSHPIVPEAREWCAHAVRLGRHPALAMARWRPTPFDLLTAEDRPVDDPGFMRAASAVRAAGVQRVFIFPLRDSAGNHYAAVGARKALPVTMVEARLIHSYCLDAVASLERGAFAACRDGRLLTARESDCLAAAGAGKSEKDTARELGISPSTVHAHIESCKRKLQAKNKVEAVVRAIRLGEIPAGGI